LHEHIRMGIKADHNIGVGLFIHTQLRWQWFGMGKTSI